ncbi:UDP-glucuronosyltransferase 2A3 [Gossypium arboreum]|uniref:UDP-glucuronosyltransferase 2A3 n=1 Tax=Gossypium arboreum TaxID=29729 RepID=A0A0B0P330_GOSAR|nr:UDP-glucuronosyltransferase 2A3 [Gossypium arboreum]
MVSLNILSMTCIGAWSFCYMSYWSSQMCWLMVIFDSFCIWPCDMVHIDYSGCNPN